MTLVTLAIPCKSQRSCGWRWQSRPPRSPPKLLLQFWTWLWRCAPGHGLWNSPKILEVLLKPSFPQNIKNSNGIFTHESPPHIAVEGGLTCWWLPKHSMPRQRGQNIQAGAKHSWLQGGILMKGWHSILAEALTKKLYGRLFNRKKCHPETHRVEHLTMTRFTNFD